MYYSIKLKKMKKKMTKMMKVILKNIKNLKRILSINRKNILNFPPLLVFQKVCLSSLNDSICYVQTFWSPTTKASDEEAV